MNEPPEFDYMYEVGSLRGTVFHVGVRADPSVDDVDSFAAVLFFELSNGSLVEAFDGLFRFRHPSTRGCWILGSGTPEYPRRSPPEWPLGAGPRDDRGATPRGPEGRSDRPTVY